MRIRSVRGIDPVKAAIIYDSVECLRLLTADGQDVRSTIQFAAENGARHCFRYLFDSTFIVQEERFKLLVPLAAKGDTSLCSLMLQFTTEIPNTNDAVIAAIRSRHDETAASLVDHGLPTGTEN